MKFSPGKKSESASSILAGDSLQTAVSKKNVKNKFQTNNDASRMKTDEEEEEEKEEEEEGKEKKVEEEEEKALIEMLGRI